MIFWDKIEYRLYSVYENTRIECLKQMVDMTMKWLIGSLIIIVGCCVLFAGYLVKQESGGRGFQAGNALVAALCFSTGIFILLS